MSLRIILGFSLPCFVGRGVMLFLSWGWGEVMGNAQVLLVWHIVRWGRWRWEFPLILDFFSFFFRGVVFLISFFVFLFSASYMRQEAFFKRFGNLVILFLLSIQALIFIPHLFFLLLGWDGLGLRSFLLVIYYNNAKRLRSGLITLAYNRLGDVFFLILVSLLLKEGSWIPFFRGRREAKIVRVFLILAAITKSAQIPFRAWLPAAMAAPTPVSALVHSSTLVTAGVFLTIRFHELVFSHWWIRNLIFFISSLTTLLAGLCALKEFDLKKIIALSTLSNLGIIIRICRLGFIELAFFHLVVHALFKALLFIRAGYLIDEYSHSQDLRFIGDVFSRFPMIRVSFLIANGALCGLPFLAGFYSKDLLLERGFFFFSSFLILATYYFGLFLTVLYSLRVIRTCIWARRNFSPLREGNQGNLLFYLPLRGLTAARITLGAFLSRKIGDLQGEVIIDFQRKMLVMGRILIALRLMYFFKFLIRYPFFNNIKTTFMGLRFRRLFFLRVIRGQLKLPFFAGRGIKVLKEVDSGWIEISMPKLSFVFFKVSLLKINILRRRRGFNLVYGFFLIVAISLL